MHSSHGPLPPAWRPVNNYVGPLPYQPPQSWGPGGPSPPSAPPISPTGREYSGHGDAGARARSGSRPGRITGNKLIAMSTSMPRSQKGNMQGPALEITDVAGPSPDAWCLPTRNREIYAVTLVSLMARFVPALFFPPSGTTDLFERGLDASTCAAKSRSFGLAYMMLVLDMLTAGGFSKMMTRTLGDSALYTMDRAGFWDLLGGTDNAGMAFPSLREPQGGMSLDQHCSLYATLGLIFQMSACNPLSTRVKEQTEARSKAITEVTGYMPLPTAIVSSVPLRTMLNSAFTTLSRLYGVEMITSLKAASVAGLGMLSNLALETLDILYGVAAPGLRGVVNVICLGCPQILSMPAVQDEIPSLVQMLKDVLGSVRANPICAGDPNWYFYLKSSGGKSFTSFTRETKKLHVIVGAILEDLGVDRLQLWEGFLDPNGIVSDGIVSDAIEMYRASAFNRPAMLELSTLIGEWRSMMSQHK